MSPKEIRVLEAYKKIIQGMSRTEILQSSPEDISLTTAKRDYDEARVLLKSNVADDVEMVTAEYEMRYNDLYQRCVNEGKYRDAKTALDSLCKLKGIDKTINVTTEFKVDWQ